MVLVAVRQSAPSDSSGPQYRSCASRRVLDGLKPSLVNASCCSVDVMKGGGGLRVTF